MILRFPMLLHTCINYIHGAHVPWIHSQNIFTLTSKLFHKPKLIIFDFHSSVLNGHGIVVFDLATDADPWSDYVPHVSFFLSCHWQWFLIWLKLISCSCSSWWQTRAVVKWLFFKVIYHESRSKIYEMPVSLW